MINFYETTGEINYLDDAKKIVQQTWDLFYDKENKILQKNPIKQNDLFVPPLDINDSNIPNGNSVFLLNCKSFLKLRSITTIFNKSANLGDSFLIPSNILFIKFNFF